ncbi:MAG: 23S rRNA (guanosine(2251)-2'-O)-methyltransferase RlmB [Candidatus Omnitrophica bacterium]|jgi:23S rRNA (guanosine2251-2'-O)-methyltransferase|nr:23S rRNA (guanosine(2251)-2'-O)-methyltransferase RlmB [Candidatus Omnitrophota bacterium]
MFLYGKNSVLERLKANPKSIKQVFLSDNFSSPVIEKIIASQKILLKRVSQNQLRKVKYADSLGGIVAEVDKFQYAEIDDLIDQPKDKQLSLIFLDRVFDPQNLGAILRVAACFGGFAVVIPKHKACQVTDTVLHVAQGAENYIPVAMVPNITNILLQAKKSGYWVVGAFSREEQDINNATLPFPICCVFGSEASDIRYGIKKYIDFKIHIPMAGVPLSLNVSSACTVFCYEISRQKKTISLENKQ